MLVNTDERRHAWMDEGFNTFINKYSTQDWFPNSKPPRGSSIAGMMRSPRRADRDQRRPPERHAARLLQYEKTGFGLLILRESVLGPERFDYAFRTYIRRWAFKSPQPADFFRTMEDAAGMDLAWFWRGWFLEDAMLDQAIATSVSILCPSVPVCVQLCPPLAPSSAKLSVLSGETQSTSAARCSETIA
jgi:hypothetical protein